MWKFDVEHHVGWGVRRQFREFNQFTTRDAWSSEIDVMIFSREIRKGYVPDIIFFLSILDIVEIENSLDATKFD